MYKSFETISDNITEAQYREDGRMHYSTLATYHRGGFNSIETLFDRKESSSLTFGSAVDALITGGENEFNSLFLVADIPSMAPALVGIVNELYSFYSANCPNISDITTSILAQVWDKYDGRNWKAETKAKFIIENGSEYYRLKFLAENKTILSTETYNEVLSAVRALKESEATKWYFQADNPFDNSVERLYQLKFHATFDNIEYSNMADLIIVDHTNKVVYPCDLKTSSHKEYDFFRSFIDWSYHIQARLYWRIIRANMDKDEYFKDFELADYRFIVVNKQTLNPLVWEFNETKTYGTLLYGKKQNIEFKDPFDLGKELSYYLSSGATMPKGINTELNNITEWLNTL